MCTSFLSEQLGRVSRLLKSGIRSQVKEYSEKLGATSGLYGFFSSLICSEPSFARARETARAFFGSDKVGFAAIDGTEYSQVFFDMVLFFGGAYASTGTVEFHDDAPPSVSYDSRILREGCGISSCVPLFLNQVVEVDQTFFTEEGGLSRPLADEELINNSRIANWIMTFAEFYLAYLFASNRNPDTKIILMDRSLSNTHSSILYDTSRRRLWKMCAILGFKVDGTPIDENDLMLARHRVVNTGLSLPPPRGDYLKSSVFFLLERSDTPLTPRQVCDMLGVRGEGEDRVKSHLKSLAAKGVLVEKRNKYHVAERYRDSWSRVRRVVEEVGRRLFLEDVGEEDENKMWLNVDGEHRILTTLDLAFLTLFAQHMAMEECWRNRKLFAGVIKDTYARDFKNHVVPICQRAQVFKDAPPQETLSILPNTDRMLLQSFSTEFWEDVKPPWSLIEYDSVFPTIIPDRGRGVNYVLGARRNKTAIERLFLRTYVQLAEGRRDPLLRSNVLLVDRLVYPEFDLRDETVLPLVNVYSGCEEPIKVIIYRDKKLDNPIQNMLLCVLASMSTSSLPEAFGHNKPLFIADKAAKWHYSLFKRVIDSVKNWVANNREVRKFIFYMSSFREKRVQFEQGRRAK
ncbi:MAG: hypothetical protein KIH01_05620 [Candidatus Freyarchaeota archaeon]|nr:hypothetical protein [Candidatus Jordarchaeia archaeon]